MKCQFIKLNKDRCKMNAISSDVFCFTHSPKTKEAKHRAVIKGGKTLKSRPNSKLLPFMVLSSKEDYLKLLEETINQLEIPPQNYQKAMSIAGLMSVAVKIQNIKTDRRNEEGLFDILRKGLFPERHEISTSEMQVANLSKRGYAKMLEVLINGLRVVNMTPKNAQAIARLSTLALDTIEKSTSGSLFQTLKNQMDMENKLTASPVQ